MSCYPVKYQKGDADNLNPIPLWGDGTEVRDIIHVDDMVDGFVTVVPSRKRRYI